MDTKHVSVPLGQWVEVHEGAAFFDCPCDIEGRITAAAVQPAEDTKAYHEFNRRLPFSYSGENKIWVFAELGQEEPLSCVVTPSST